MLHSPDAAPETVQHAQKSIDICATLIAKNTSHLRHGGSWFIARKSFLCACILLAVVLAPERRLQPPSNWSALIHVALEMLGFWGQDAEDICRMRDVLEAMYHVVSRRGPTRPL